MYKLRGKILNKQKEEIKSKKGEVFEKLLFTIEESDTGFNHKHQFEIFGAESIQMHDEYIFEGRYVRVEFYIKSREYNDKFYNTLMIKSVYLEELRELNEDTTNIF